MVNASIWLAQDLIVDRLISKVRFKITRSGFATHTDKRHNGISGYLMSSKWGIVLYKAKRNLQSTTQDNLRSYLKPLTRRCRTYFLSHRLCQLNCWFYIDTLFAREKYIFGNKCAKIFTNGEFVQIISMRSKSESGTTLDRINRDVGVANKIFMDTEPE